MSEFSAPANVAHAGEEPANSAQADFWTRERVDRLAEYWAQGLTGAAIGDLIGASRSAVIGKANRLGLAERRKRKEPGAQSRQPRANKAKRRRAAPTSNNARANSRSGNRPIRPRIKADPKTKEPASLDIALIDLEAGQCKYPHGDGPFLFCGHSRDPPTTSGRGGMGRHWPKAWVDRELEDSLKPPEADR